MNDLSVRKPTFDNCYRLRLFLSLAALLFSPLNTASQLALTPEQHTYLAEKKIISYCVDPDWMPFEAIKNGVHIGMSKDYIDLLSNTLEIPFQLVPTTRWRQTLQYLEHGQCDVIPMLNRTDERAQYADFSHPYFRDPNVLVVRTNDARNIKSFKDLSGKTLAVIDGYMQEETLRAEFPEIATISVASELAGLIRVSSGDIDAVAGSLLAVTRHIQNAGLSNLHISSDLPQGDELRMAVRKENKALLSILNLALDNLSYEDHSIIYNAWNPISRTAKTDYTLAWQVGIALFVILTLVFERYRASKKVNALLQEKNMELKAVHAQLSHQHSHLLHVAKYDALTGLHNRRSILECIETELSRAKRQPMPISLLIFDLDKFKTINDTLGHNAGDQALKTFANTLKKVARETDVCGRWGGEEFIVISPNTNRDAACVLAERFQIELSKETESYSPEITCSIGIAEHQPQESFEKWFDRADKALYRAKMRGGRNYVSAESSV